MALEPRRQAARSLETTIAALAANLHAISSASGWSVAGEPVESMGQEEPARAGGSELCELGAGRRSAEEPIGTRGGSLSSV